VPRVIGIVAEVEGIIGGPADAAVSGGEAGMDGALLSPGGLQVIDLALTCEFHGTLRVRAPGKRPEAKGKTLQPLVFSL
jgi:hypothetical protein